MSEHASSSPLEPGLAVIHCGNCGVAVSPKDVICPACGALLAAYQAPSGSETGSPTATESVPTGVTPPMPLPGPLAAVPHPRQIYPAAIPQPSTPAAAPTAAAATGDRPTILESRVTFPNPPVSAPVATAPAPVPVPAPLPNPAGLPPAELPAPRNKPMPEIDVAPALESSPRPVRVDEAPSAPRPARGLAEFLNPKMLPRLLPFVIILVVILANIGTMTAVIAMLAIAIGGLFLVGVLRSARATSRKTTHMPRDRRRS